ncbi:recombinase family protein [Bacillus sp. JJ1562]|uniref:recombinase family protein n=1 Tax=Bacillus sp. JJ1562 TaxID=3122960 RepID=UPI0030010BBD
MTMFLIKDFLAEYLRVSTGNQDLQMQIDANKEYLKKFGVEQVMQFKDYDVSATKLKMDERPALRRLLKLIQGGRLKKIFVYDRDRFARDVYEYVYIVKLCYKYDVELIFTAEGAAPFSKDIVQETWYGLFAQMEGQKINTRLHDVRSRYPQSLIGYKKDKNSRTYKADKDVSKHIRQLFEEVSKTSSLETLIDIVIRYCKILNRDPKRIVGILNTAFFSAHGRTIDGEYFELPHVDAIISLSLFQKVQVVLRKYGQAYEDVVRNSLRESFIIPTCGKCGEQMVFKKGRIGKFGEYICQKHRKIRISSEDVDITLKQTVEKIIKKMDVEKLENVCRKNITKQEKVLKGEHTFLSEKVEELCVNVCANLTPYTDPILINKPVQQIVKKKEELFLVEDKLKKLTVLTDEVKRIAKYVKYSLQNSLSLEELSELVDLMIAGIEINVDYVQVTLYFDDFFDSKEVSII